MAEVSLPLREAAVAPTTASKNSLPAFLTTSKPVLLPKVQGLLLPQPEFLESLKKSLCRQDENEKPTISEKSEKPTAPKQSAKPDAETPVSLMSALEQQSAEVEKQILTENENLMRGENYDLAFKSTKSALVDLFSELETAIDGSRLKTLLHEAWDEDPLLTLKIIFNARSIHLGKSSRPDFYKCLGWLATNHPYTLVLNLPWLVRPIIPKKLPKEDKPLDGEEIVMVQPEANPEDPLRFDVKDGVSHGYWKDLLNAVALAANDHLEVNKDPKQILNVRVLPKDRTYDPVKAAKQRQAARSSRHINVCDKLVHDDVYRAIHLTVARLFAEQLKRDLGFLRAGDKQNLNKISLCGKWAPSQFEFHDKHTLIVSSIAEILHPASEFPKVDSTDRELYLRHAREAYRRDLSSLRRVLQVVERDVSAENFANIHYDRLPSIAMRNYTSLFITKDSKRFEAYIDKVVAGTKQISGATLTPGQLISRARGHGVTSYEQMTMNPTKYSTKQLLDAKQQSIADKALDGQWKSLVQRIRDSGTLENCIAVCDVSGSMTYPRLGDDTTPMDHAIALSLIIAEVTKPPFGGAFITFSESPQLVKVDGFSNQTTLSAKAKFMERSDWGGSTNFVAVFEDLILPTAIKYKVKPEDMVKRIFVFSDMHFNQAGGNDRYKNSIDRIKQKYAEAGYEMPEMVYWNLAGRGTNRPTAKQALADEEGASLVTGYSQALIKMFLDGSSFDEDEAEEEEEELVEIGDDGEESGLLSTREQKRKKLDPLATVKKAVGHKAYSMLEVVD